MKSIDLNVDIGEGFAFDAELLRYATSANICCGEHAGSQQLTQTTITACQSVGISFGSHPGYDRASMGRASLLSVAPHDLEKSIREQLESFGLCAFVKPHGTLYTESASNQSIASILESALSSSKSKVFVGLPGTLHERIANNLGWRFIAEGFADRAYTPEGLLVSRSQTGAILTDPETVVAQATGLASIVDTICLHGDNEHCVHYAQMIHNALIEAGFEVKSWRS